ncbi:hypothetical protein CLV72_10741 [Allonocardiopsis opalescens]|uniref:Sulfotransferase family protein n=2 Tax=Allonocardiopsis opalescens TaxID=1144618 RepID=A0A2T0PYC3_9ACTN|nr:hypothetical protein CLV72_10741 [Allonocardiopsis opalescens]
MMVERGDYTVLHEPFSHVADFGRTVVDGEEVRDEAELIRRLRGLPADRRVFFKDTTDFRYAAALADEEFWRAGAHTFIIREPADAIASHFAVNPRVTRDDIGFERLAEIYDAVAAATGAEPVVIDSNDLIARPEQTVRAYCARVGLRFRPEALNWRPSLLPEWRGTRPWHEATSRTSGFTATAPGYQDTVHNNALLAGYLDHHLPFYRRLHDRRLVVPG